MCIDFFYTQCSIEKLLNLKVERSSSSNQPFSTTSHIIVEYFLHGSKMTFSPSYSGIRLLHEHTNIEHANQQKIYMPNILLYIFKTWRKKISLNIESSSTHSIDSYA